MNTIDLTSRGFLTVFITMFSIIFILPRKCSTQVEWFKDSPTYEYQAKGRITNRILFQAVPIKEDLNGYKYTRLIDLSSGHYIEYHQEGRKLFYDSPNGSILIYDFDMQKGDTLTINTSSINTVAVLTEVGDTTINNKTYAYQKHVDFSSNSQRAITVLEGIGPIKGIGENDTSTCTYIVPEAYCLAPNDLFDLYFRKYVSTNTLIEVGSLSKLQPNDFNLSKRWIQFDSIKNKYYHLRAKPKAEFIDNKAFYPFEVSYDEDVNSLASKWDTIPDIKVFQDDNVIFLHHQNEVTILYDFTLEKGDTYIHPLDSNIVYKVIDTDSIMIGNELKKTLTLSHLFDPEERYYWIEDVGDKDCGFLAPLQYANPRSTNLTCYFEEEVLIYKSPFFIECWAAPSSVNDNILPSLNIKKNQSSLLINQALPKTSYQILNLGGQGVSKGVLMPNGEINLLHIPSGIYFLYIQGFSPYKFHWIQK